MIHRLWCMKHSALLSPCFSCQRTVLELAWYKEDSALTLHAMPGGKYVHFLERMHSLHAVVCAVRSHYIPSVWQHVRSFQKQA